MNKSATKMTMFMGNGVIEYKHGIIEKNSTSDQTPNYKYRLASGVNQLIHLNLPKVKVRIILTVINILNRYLKPVERF